MSVQSTSAGGFDYPHSVAADPRTGVIYVAEADSARIQELTSGGEFVAMFGWDVNGTEDKRARATQAEKNLCTAASKDVCQAGIAGTAAGQLDTPGSVAVDPRTGDVYVLGIERGDFRVDKLTGDGRFLWRAGKRVNETTGANLCTAQEIERAGDRCGPGLVNASESAEHLAFKFSGQSGDVLAVGGPEDLLYVGDEHRVQVLGSNGAWKGEISLASISAEPGTGVTALAVSPTGETYLVYRVGNGELELPAEQANIVHKFAPSGEQISEYEVKTGIPGAVDSIHSMAVDELGRLALMGFETGGAGSGRFGLLYNASTGALLTSFPAPIDMDGIAFNAGGELDVATAVDEEIAVYIPAPLSEFAREPLPCEVEINKGAQEAYPCYASGRYTIPE
ncbi:MAG: hypothetical protein WBV85_08060 [Solirubrobacteraceae bacterium]